MGLIVTDVILALHNPTIKLKFMRGRERERKRERQRIIQNYISRRVKYQIYKNVDLVGILKQN
jgi:hypothetical protein